MEKLAYLDTHVVVWLFAGQVERFPKRALRAIEERALWISPIIYLELQYLYETAKLTVLPAKIIDSLKSEIGLKVCTKPFESVSAEAAKHSWTRDPFDRIIAAQASLTRAALITKDDSIQTHYSPAFWS